MSDNRAVVLDSMGTRFELRADGKFWLVCPEVTGIQPIGFSTKEAQAVARFINRNQGLAKDAAAAAAQAAREAEKPAQELPENPQRGRQEVAEVQEAIDHAEQDAPEPEPQERKKDATDDLLNLF